VSALQDEREAGLYLASRSAFWLFPDRWEGVEEGGLMRFDDGSWQPPPKLAKALRDRVCPNCFSFECEDPTCEARAPCSLDAPWRAIYARNEALRLGFECSNWRPRLICRLLGRHTSPATEY
jgi:hypothetical protein